MAGSIKSSPRGPLMGLFADTLKSAQTGMNQVKLPYFGGAGDLLLGGAPKLADDISYQGLSAVMSGGNVATGGIGTYGIKPDALDLAGVMTGLGSAAKPLAKVAAKPLHPVAERIIREMGASSLLENPMAKKQIGAVYSSSGGLTGNMEDAEKFAKGAIDRGFIPEIINTEGGTVYVTLSMPNYNKSGTLNKKTPKTAFSYNGQPFKARFADHPSYWGSTASSDPFTGNTVDDLLGLLDGEKKNLPEARFVPSSSYGHVSEYETKIVPSLSGKSMVEKTSIVKRPFNFLGEDYKPKVN